MFNSVKESQTQGLDCVLGHDSTEMDYELKIIMPTYLHKWSAEKAKMGHKENMTCAYVITLVSSGILPQECITELCSVLCAGGYNVGK
jgi:hypothetical protein